jgi:hypothetical protein
MRVAEKLDWKGLKERLIIIWSGQVSRIDILLANLPCQTFMYICVQDLLSKEEKIQHMLSYALTYVIMAYNSKHRAVNL